jgi:hypothetical protein
MKQLKSTSILVIAAVLVMASCSQAKYGSRTIRVKGSKAYKTVILKSTQKNQKTATLNVKEEAEVRLVQTPDQVVLEPSVKSRLNNVVSTSQLDNPGYAFILPAQRRAKAAALSKKVQAKVMNNKRVAKALNTIESKATEVSRKNATDSDSLLRDILVIVLVLLLVSLILSILPNPLSYILSVVLTILLLVYLIQMLT